MLNPYEQQDIVRAELVPPRKPRRGHGLLEDLWRAFIVALIMLFLWVALGLLPIFLA